MKKIHSNLLKYLVVLFLMMVYPFFAPIYGNENTPEADVNSYIDYIAVNNKIVEIDEDGYIYVDKQDSVKISGFANTGETIQITINEEVFETKADENGIWFVLFSISDLEGENFTATLTSDSDTLEVCKLTLGDKPFDDIESSESATNIKVLWKYILITLFSLLVLFASFLFGQKFGKKKK